MLHRVALVRTVIVFLPIVLPLLVTANVVPSSPIFVILMMEAIRSSEMSVLTRTTRRNISEDGILHSHRIEQLRSYVLVRRFRSGILFGRYSLPILVGTSTHLAEIFLDFIQSLQISGLVGVVTGYGLTSRWGIVQVPMRGKYCLLGPDRLWGPPSLLCSGYRNLSPG
jgi:hypothetical protein